MTFNLEILPQEFSVCTVAKITQEHLDSPVCFVAKTDKECSLVCPEKNTPPDALKINSGWRALRFCGVLDFSLTGVLAGASTLLAREKISIFAISTYETDYILVKSDDLSRAVDTLRKTEEYTIK